MNSFSNPTWRSFESLSSDAEAAAASASCLFSLDTLEVATVPGAPIFALTERKFSDVWRWAIISAKGGVIQCGWAPSQAEAERTATEAMREQSSDSSERAS